MQGYQGYGYSDDFVKNMDEVVAFIKNNPKKSALVVADCDSICSSCPHRKTSELNHYECLKKSKLENLEKIKKEKKLAEFLGIEINKEYQIEKLFCNVNEKIHSKEIANEYYCERCQWYSVCLWYQSRK
jgi:hypothetical protein